VVTQIETWRAQGIDIALVIGGADGLAAEFVATAAQRWSLSPLTLPHALARVIVAEQLFRAWTLSTHHPYHRD
jgi:23S rRNA (pseudouridine1915-N3)-methyltransferase